MPVGSHVENAKFVECLNPAQQQAVCSSVQHLRVLAGAGSGKTRVLVSRIALLLEQNLSPYQILAVTFTNKAAGAMRAQLEKLVGYSAKSMWVGTFHGLAHRILRQYYIEAGLCDNFQIIDSEDQSRLIKRLVKELNLDETECDPKRAQGFINRQKDEGRRHQDLGQATTQEMACFMEVYRVYEAHCIRTHLVDFAELLLKVYELLITRADILKSFQDRFKHILVDEFQDTNTIQYKWLKCMCSPTSSMTIVGDDDQSIYGWRGAKIENIHRFSQDFPNGETIRLEQNYRSTDTILTAANALIQNNVERLGKKLWTEGSKGAPIYLYGAINEIDEARFIVDRIRKWVFEGGSYSDIAVLYRSNAQSRAIEQSLCQSNLPYRIYGGLRFFDRAEVKDVLAYLRLLANFNDDTAFERIINMPPRGIGDRTVELIRNQAALKKISLWNAALEILPTLSPGRITKGLESFFDLIEALSAKLPTVNFPDFVEEVLAVSGLLHYIKTQPGERTHMRLDNIQEVVSAAKQYACELENAQDMSEQNLVANHILSQFLSEVALDSSEREIDKTEDGLKLMTLHSAKGLEFPLVFLAGLEEGLFPHHRSIHTQEVLEEERRLCYVGLTRAMQQLVLTYAEKRAFGSSGKKGPSRFVKEIPEELIERVCVKAVITKSSARLASKNKLTSTVDLPFKIGEKVSHPRFGRGTVLGGEGSGESARVEVQFESAGNKWLILAYAKLESTA